MVKKSKNNYMNRKNGRHKYRKLIATEDPLDQEKDKKKEILREKDSAKGKRRGIGPIETKIRIEREAALEVETESIRDLPLPQKSVKRGKPMKAGNLLTKANQVTIIILIGICRNLTLIVFTAKILTKIMIPDNSREIMIKMMIQ